MDVDCGFGRLPVTSGLPQQADNPGDGRYVSKVPGAEAGQTRRFNAFPRSGGIANVAACLKRAESRHFNWCAQ